MKHLKVGFVLVTCIIATGCGGYTGSVNSKSTENSVNSYPQGYMDEIEENRMTINSNNRRYKDIIFRSVNFARLQNQYEEIENNNFKVGVTSHHLPIAVTFIGDFYNFLQENTSSKTIVVIGPDHPEKCNGKINTGLVNYDTAFGKLSVDVDLYTYLSEFKGINLEDKCLLNEHSIGVHADYIRLLWGEDVKFLPITISSSLDDKRVNYLSLYLSQIEDAIFIISVDFNHYRTVDVAYKFDMDTKNILETFDPTRLKIDHVDSPPSLKIGMKIAEIFNRKNANILDHKNSYDFTGQKSNTTSYFSISFE